MDFQAKLISEPWTEAPLNLAVQQWVISELM
jgi:hypothetical protein